MKYKIQFKYGMQCGEWDDLLDHDHYEGQGSEPVVGTHESMPEYESIEKANAQIEIEKDEYRDSLEENVEDREHTLEEIDGIVEDYQMRVVPSHLTTDARRNLVEWLLKRGHSITVHDEGEVLGEKNETSITKIMADLNSVYHCSFVVYKDGERVGWVLTLNSDEGMVDPDESVADFGGSIIDDWFDRIDKKEALQ